jgi:hypothetical protein
VIITPQIGALLQKQSEKKRYQVQVRLGIVRTYSVNPVFHFARIVPKRTGEHAQIENRFINPRTSNTAEKRLRMH